MKPLIVCLFIIAGFCGVSLAYDPLTVFGAGTEVELTVLDPARNRQIPLLVYLPAETISAPVILFSHGLGGTRNGSAYLGKHWSARGYVACFLQHPGSDDSAWRDAPPGQRMQALKRAGSLQNFMLRVKDVPAVLDQLGRWQEETGHPLVGRMDLKHVGMSGHSFGAITTQAVSGQAAGGVQRFTDPRIKAALPMSQSPPALGSTAEAFGSVKIPWMLMTGTKDTAIIADFTPEKRAKVYPALPPVGKYELVLDNAEHSAFTDHPLPGDKEARNANHHRVILALSTAFWDAYLKEDAEAKAWLDGDGVNSVLDSRDSWQRK